MRMDYIKIGQRIRDFRKEKKMSQWQTSRKYLITQMYRLHWVICICQRTRNMPISTYWTKTTMP